MEDSLNTHVLLTIGKTHTGKSTFARDISTYIPNAIILETDPVAVFIRTHFPALRALDIDHSGSFTSPSLKYVLFRAILSYALEHNTNVILSNSNMYENGRKDVLDVIKEKGKKTIGIYFNYPEEVLLQRAASSGRDINVLSVSKDFNELIINQRTRFQPPHPGDFDYFFEVTDPADLPQVRNDILTLYGIEA